MPEILIQNRKTYYREWGRGEKATIIVLHGWGVDSAQYEALGPMLATHEIRVLVPDLPGWGNTPAPATAWNVGDYVEWVREFAEKFHNPSQPPLIFPPKADPPRTERGGESSSNVPPLRIRGGRGSYDNEIILFGHSFGGRIAIKYAAKYPDDLRALILCAAAGIKMPETLLKRGLGLLAKIGKGVFRLPLLNILDAHARKLLYRIAGSYDYMNAKGVMVDVLVKAVEEDLLPYLSQIKTPTLLLWGTEDRATPYKDGQTMARLIPNAKLITFEGERHNLPKNVPEKLAHAIKQFLDKTNIL